MNPDYKVYVRPIFKQSLDPEFPFRRGESAPRAVRRVKSVPSDRS
jgi:hypothetical protein